MDGQERRVKSLLEYWPLLMLLGSGVVGYIQMKATVADLKLSVDTMHEKRDQIIKEMNERQRADHDDIQRLKQWKDDQK
jgi:hypothetical protein